MLKKELEKELNRTKLILDYAREEIKGKGKEIERLNNIINGLEKDIKNNKVAIGIKKNSNYAIPVEYVLDKLQELKGDDKE